MIRPQEIDDTTLTFPINIKCQHQHNPEEWLIGGNIMSCSGCGLMKDQHWHRTEMWILPDKKGAKS